MPFRRIFSRVLFLLICAAFLPARSAPAAGEEGTCRLHAAAWSGGWRDRAGHGRLAWLPTVSAGWRLEVVAAAGRGDGERGPGMAALLQRTGEGWTLLAGRAGRVYGAAWGEPLRPLDPGVAGRLHALLAAWPRLESGAGPDRSPVPSRLVWCPPDAPASLRRRLARRRRGTGGAGGVLRLRPAEETAAGTWRITDSRWPGSVELRLLPARRVTCDAELLEVTDLPLGDLILPDPDAP